MRSTYQSKLNKFVVAAMLGAAVGIVFILVNLLSSNSKLASNSTSHIENPQKESGAVSNGNSQGTSPTEAVKSTSATGPEIPGRTLQALISEFENLSELELFEKIAESEKLFAADRLIERSNAGQLNANDKNEMALRLREIHALKVVRTRLELSKLRRAVDEFPVAQR